MIINLFMLSVLYIARHPAMREESEQMGRGPVG